MNMSGVNYDRVTKTFHWFMAIIIVYTTIAGYGMHLTTQDSPMFHFLVDIKHVACNSGCSRVFGTLGVEVF